MTQLVPLVTAGDVAFWIAAPIVVLAALAFLLSRRPVHSAVCVAAVMIGLAVLYAALEAPFLFVAQIIVYTGAILMLFLFVVMLIGVRSTDSIVETIKGQRVAGVLAALGLGVLMIMLVGQYASLGAPAGMELANASGNVEGLAKLVFHDYFLLFEVTAALLIVAAVGAILLTHGDDLKRKASQLASSRDRARAYAEEGAHPGPRPSSGVFARANAISVPALLPDGTVSEKSLSPTLVERGIGVDVEELRASTSKIQSAVEGTRAEIEGRKA